MLKGQYARVIPLFEGSGEKEDLLAIFIRALMCASCPQAQVIDLAHYVY